MTDTPTRILEAAWALVIERETVDVTVAEIAAAAGVSRQLVYFHFDNRAGLLTAMARHRDESSGFVDEVAASRTMPPAEGLEHLLRSWCEYMPQIVSVARALEAALVTGDDGGSAWRQRMGELRGALRIALDRVELAPGLDGRRGRGLGVVADPADDLAAPGRRARLDAPSSTPTARCARCSPN